MIQLVIRALREILQGNPWAFTFEANGLGGSQAHVSRSIKEALNYDSLAQSSTDRPSIAMVRMCWPKNTLVNEELLWKAFPAVPLPADAPAHGLGRYTVGGASASGSGIAGGRVVDTPIPLEDSVRTRLWKKSSTAAFDRPD